MRLYLVLLGLGLVAPPSLAGLQFRVTTTQDGGDDLPGDGVCANGQGLCSLRAAVDEANAVAGRDTVVLPAGVYELSPVPGGLGAGEVRILDALDIEGAGMDETFIDGRDSSPIFYVGLARTRIAGLTIRNGNAGAKRLGNVIETIGPTTIASCRITASEGDEYGAVILNHGELSIESSVLEDNRGLLIEARAGLTLEGVSMRHNEGTIEDDCGAGPVIRRSEIAENGGGIYGCPIVSDSVIRDNDGAAIACPGSGVVILRSVIADNSGTGVNCDGGVWVVDSTIRGNDHRGQGRASLSGLGAVGRGGVVAIGGVRVLRSSIVGNFGRGVDVEIEARLENATISGNTAGGISVGEGSVTIDSSTIVDNGGPGIHQYLSAEVVVRNSILSGNLDAGVAADCRGAVEFAGYNLLGNPQGCEAILDATDRVGVDPMIAPIEDMGGPALTRPPLDGSPAIEGGPALGSAACPSFDQRGVRRPQGQRCDIGAVERLASCGDGIVDAAEDCDDGNLDEDDCCSSLCRFTAVVAGDCDGDGSVTVGELVFAVGLATTRTLALECESADRDGNLQIGIAELVSAVGNAVDGVQLTCSSEG